jgi:hypothetical protein
MLCRIRWGGGEEASIVRDFTVGLGRGWEGERKL